MFIRELLSLALHTGAGISEEPPTDTMAEVASSAERHVARTSSNLMSLRAGTSRHSGSKKPDSQSDGSPLLAMAMAGGLAAGARRFRLQSGSMTDVGENKRLRGEGNEDAFFADDDAGLYIVADGVSGRVHGEVASKIVVDEVPPLVADSLRQRDESEILDILREALGLVHMSILNESILSTQYRGMSTTAVGLLIHGAQAYVAHSGDSRLYHVRAGKITQVTQDHSWIQQEMRAGRMTPAEALVSQMRHVITSSLGTNRVIDTKIVGKIEDGDRFIVCSDGLTDVVNDVRLLEILEHEKDPDRAARNLIDEANRNGGPDNITVIVVDVTLPSK